MKPNDMDLTFEDVLAEIEALPKPGKKTLLDSLDRLQRKVLVAGIESDKQFTDFYRGVWKKKGWPGTEVSLKKAYKKLKTAE